MQDTLAVFPKDADCKNVYSSSAPAFIYILADDEIPPAAPNILSTFKLLVKDGDQTTNEKLNLFQSGLSEAEKYTNECFGGLVDNYDIAVLCKEGTSYETFYRFSVLCNTGLVSLTIV